MLDDLDVPDPTDFPPETTAPGLRSLDEALRCTICTELYTAPVTVNCSHGHCFCSECIREQLNTKQECPLCRAPILEVHLRRNPAVEDIVKAWIRARPLVLDLLKEKDHPPPITPQSPTIPLISEGTPSRKRRRGSSPATSEVAEVAGPSKRPALQTGTSLSSASASDLSIVACPMCNQQVEYALVNTHLDNGCPQLSVTSSKLASPRGKKTQKTEWSRILKGGGAAAGEGAAVTTKGKSKKRTRSPPQEPTDVEIDFATADPIPKMSYDMLPLKTIKDRLSEYALPTDGDKALLSARHQKWVTLFNANLDASPSARKTAGQLRKELKRWEDGQREARRNKALAAVDLTVYVKQNKSAFTQLIAKMDEKQPPRRPRVPGSLTSRPTDTNAPSTSGDGRRGDETGSAD